MRKLVSSRILAAVMALAMLLALVPVSALAEEITYVLDVTEDVPSFGSGTMKDGETKAYGTDDYFTLFASKKTKVDGSNKNFADGYTASMRLNMQSKTVFAEDGNIIAAVQIKTSGPAKVKVWWVCGGDNREVAVFDGNGQVVTQTNEGPVKNSLYISELSLEAADTYYIGNLGDGGNYFFKIEVTESEVSGGVSRDPWAEVTAPVITGVEDNGKGQMKATVSALVGNNGGDEVVVMMYDASGKLLEESTSILEKNEHTLSFTPEGSGEYTFRAELRREGEAAKTSEDVKGSFVLPLETPIMISGTSKGNGSVALSWTAVKEATVYKIFADGVEIGSTKQTSFVATSLKIGQKYSFHVEAVRGSESKASGTLSVTVTKEEKVTWGFTHYGPSTNADNNGYVGDVNETGSVTVYSEGGKGKIVPGSVDGVAFYYTAIPTRLNFTLRAKVTVDSWTLSNGQEGFGLMVADRLGVSGDTSNLWNNSYMALASKIEYRYDSESESVLLEGGTKYTMKLGLGIIGKTGVTKQNLPLFEANDNDAINQYFLSESRPLDTSAGYYGLDAGTYNIVGNYSGEVTGNIENAMKTSFILEIQRNNTGYFITYYNEAGEVIRQEKFYGTDALDQLDADYVYAGFFAARNARATFSDVELTTILPSEDAPPEERPVTKIEPTVTVSSGSVTTAKNYQLILDSNVSGTVNVLLGDQMIVENQKLIMDERFTTMVELKQYGANNIRIEFTPDPDQDLGPDTVLSSTDRKIFNHSITYNKGNYHSTIIYVSPNADVNGGAGTKEFPYDIYTAVRNVVAGQTIVLMEGTYYLEYTLAIERGMNGAPGNPIRMIADPEAKTRPVLDFQKLVAGIVHGGDYWYFAGFDVTNSAPGQKGFQISGSNNVLDQIHTYKNGNSGVQISRLKGTDKTIDTWPANNLVLNCVSYLNADPGEEDADGFAAKLTCGEGNVFDGCVAYNNADDGWDLYAKVETGKIGSVTIRNCVAYNNGLREDGTVGKGNGNGFKMGGDSLSGKHVLENCVAFHNKAKGLDSNSCPDIIIRNCISYNNGSYNVALYTNNANTTDFEASGILSFKDSSCPFDGSLAIGENLKPKGEQDTQKYLNESNYFWNGTTANNSQGATVGAEIFKSLEFKGIKFNADGTWDLQGFLELTSKAPAGSGTTGASTPSDENINKLPAEGEHNFSTEWSYTDVDGNADRVYHWHECECGARGDMAEHTFQTIIDKEPVGNTPGSKHDECSVCHFKKAAVAIYPENPTPTPTDPTQPVDPSTPPASSAPADNNQGGQEQQDNSGTVVLLVVLLVVALAAGAGAVVLILWKKKH